MRHDPICRRDWAREESSLSWALARASRAPQCGPSGWHGENGTMRERDTFWHDPKTSSHTAVSHHHHVTVVSHYVPSPSVDVLSIPLGILPLIYCNYLLCTSFTFFNLWGYPALFFSLFGGRREVISPLLDIAG